MYQIESTELGKILKYNVKTSNDLFILEMEKPTRPSLLTIPFQGFTEYICTYFY